MSGRASSGSAAATSTCGTARIFRPNSAKLPSGRYAVKPVFRRSTLECRRSRRMAEKHRP
jgi:hypothetical protein